MITVTINGKKIALNKPVTILEAARKADIYIPTLCNHPMLEPFGGCRLCLVEIEKMPKLQASCTQYVTDGMTVWTETEKVLEARRAMLEFLLINHPLDCPYCDKAGECDLQDSTMQCGPAIGRFKEGKRKLPECYDDPIIVTNMERCILCSRCVRMCSDVQGAHAITITNRGSKSCVEPFSGGRFDCEYCGNCITVCPVGSLMSRLHKHTYRPWYIEKEIETVCSFCGVGCSFVAQIRGDSIVRVEPRPDLGLNKGLLCVKGRFGFDYTASPSRLKSPLLQKNGDLKQTTWAEALSHTAGKLKEIKEKYGPAAIGAVASGLCTNEDNYTLQRFMRSVVGSNNIDSTTGFFYGPAQRFLEDIFGQGVTLNPMQGIANSDGVFVIGADPSAVAPVLGLQVRAASRKGIPVVTVGHMPGLKRFATCSLVPDAFSEPALLNRLISGLMKKRPVCGENEFFEGAIKKFMLSTGDDIADPCGLSNNDIERAVNELDLMTNPAVLIGRQVVQRSDASVLLLQLSVLTYLLNGRIYLISELPNDQGLVDMGCRPDMLPGGRPVFSDSMRKRYEDSYGSEIPSAQGMSLMEMIQAAHEGNLKALYVMGENLLPDLPDTGYVKEALSKLELLVVQDTLMNETAELAHVVLPACSWPEAEGSYTNFEGRMQHVRKAVHGEAMEGWKIISEVAKIIGSDFGFLTVVDILAELTKVSPIHKGITYAEMDGGKCLWPYNGEPLRDSAKDFALPDITLLKRAKDCGRPYLFADQQLFHSGTIGRNSSALSMLMPASYVKVGNALSEKKSIQAGDVAGIASGIKSAELDVIIDPDLKGMMVLIPNILADKGVMSFMKWNMNPDFKNPALDGNEIEISKLRSKAEEVSA
ncbi:MAG: NADH dehydrogenase (quinone) subunit G [Nitrospirae bacterium]|nr:MAG: NADH dehydrogenase (quinone) subunit G [Nitrospirota bacterium]